MEIARCCCQNERTSRKLFSSMKNIFILLIYFSTLFCSAQDQHPKISFTETDQWVIHIGAQKSIDLNGYSPYTEFEIVSYTNDRILLAYDRPSAENSKGRCAAGSEKGYLVIELSTTRETEEFVLESCLLSIEVSEQKHVSAGIVEYTCESFINSDSYILSVDSANATVSQRVKK